MVRVVAGARREAGVTQRELARRLGKAPSHVARIEAGQRRLDTFEFYLVCRALEIDPTRLFATVVPGVEAVLARAPGAVGLEIAQGAPPIRLLGPSGERECCRRAVAEPLQT